MDEDNRVLIRTYISEDLAKKLTAHAEALEMAPATLIRVALVQYIRQYERAGVLPTLEPIGDQLKRM
jgi:hypothetical protein